ncbi:MAG TPA: glycosyltransferase [Anaerolineae bacterium]|nr:glycosyltransferase [Anaerolineae bacterium]
MMRVLFIARYRHRTMSRKVELLAAQPDVTICHICPRYWHDELVQVQQATTQTTYRQIAVDIHRPADPHRALYRTVTFALRDFQPDIIHAEEEPDSLSAAQIAVARRLFAPRAKLLLHTWQNLERPLKWYVRAILRMTLPASNGIMCASREAQDLLQRYGYTKLTPLLPALGVDTRVFTPGEMTSREQFTIAFVGRLVPEKGLDTLIDAVGLLTRSSAPLPVKLLIIGDGPYRSDIEHYAAKLRDAVQFTAAMPPAEIAPQLRQIDVLVLPSRTTPVWKEQFGRVLIEAMACGVPVVGSNSGAIPEVIGDAGLIFPEGDANALADCLQRLIAVPELRAELSQLGLARVQVHYTQERIAQQTLEFYRQVLA